MIKNKVVHISVTSADIRKGTPNIGASCPVARAIRRTCPNLEYVHATYEKLYLKPPNGSRNWRESGIFFPEEVNMWITAFDNGEKVKPFEFDLELPC